MHVPQIIYLALLIIGLTVALVKDGEEKRDRKGRVERYSFGWSAASAAISVGILIWGGFFG